MLHNSLYCTALNFFTPFRYCSYCLKLISDVLKNRLTPKGTIVLAGASYRTHMLSNFEKKSPHMDPFNQLSGSGFGRSGFQIPAFVGVQIRIPDPDADPDLGFHD